MRSASWEWFVLVTLVVVGMFSRSGSFHLAAQDATTHDAEPTARSPGATTLTRPLTEAEIELASRAHQLNQVELDAGRMAAQNARAAEVRRYAERLVRDHAQNDRELVSFMRNQNAELRAPALANNEEERVAEQRQTVMARLHELQGDDFDREFLQAMIADHKHAIETVQSGLEDVQNQRLRLMLTELVPQLEAHLEEAERLSIDLPGAVLEEAP